MASRFEISQTPGGSYRFHLVANNGQVIASGQNYAKLDGCHRGIQSVRNHCAAPVEDQTVGGQTVPHPKFELYTDKSGRYRFRLKAERGEIVAVGGCCPTREDCLSGIRSVAVHAPGADILNV